MRLPKTRLIRVLVKDSAGKVVKNAEVTVQDTATKTPLQGQKYSIGEDGVTRLVVPVRPDVDLVVAAPGYEVQSQTTYWASDYVFRLRRPGDVMPLMPLSAVQPAVVSPVQPERKARSLTVVVETPEGTRLKDAEIAILDAATKKIFERKFLIEGLGIVQVEAEPGQDIELLATAPGRVTESLKVGKEESYAFKLRRRESEARMKVTVKDATGRRVVKASVLATEDGRELGRSATDDQGVASVAFTYGDEARLLVEVHHGGYQARKTPVRLPRDESLEVVLLPVRPVVKSSFATVLVLSKSFTASRAAYNRVRDGLGRILDECAEHEDLWSGVGLLGLGDGRVREVVPLSKTLDEGAARQARAALGGLEPYAGTLSWRDLETLAQYLAKSGQIGEAGCEVLVLAPRNLAMDDTLSLYDAGGEALVESFRAKNLRLRLIEVGTAEEPNRAYQELCERTQGFYQSVPSGENLAQDIVQLQFHYPTPPPGSRAGKKTE